MVFAEVVTTFCAGDVAHLVTARHLEPDVRDCRTRAAAACGPTDILEWLAGRITGWETVTVSDADLTVEVVPYSADWTREFIDMRTALVEALEGAALSIEHIGSTAVPGLSSKPTIDILVVVGSPGDFIARLVDVEALGFSYRKDNAHIANADHLFLRRVVDGRRTHHLHVLTEGSPEITGYRMFRDALRDDVAFAREYEQLKVRLAAEFSSDRERYVAEKEQWVTERITGLRDQQNVDR